MYRCPSCARPVHIFCGAAYAEDEEGFGSRRWCSPGKIEACSLRNAIEIEKIQDFSFQHDPQLSNDEFMNISSELYSDLGSTDGELENRHEKSELLDHGKEHYKKLSKEQKALILSKSRKNASWTQAEIANWTTKEFGIDSLSQATISAILRSGEATKHHGNLTNAQKQELCQYHETNPRIKQKDLAQWSYKQFNLSKVPTQPTISNILKNKKRFLEQVSQKDKALRRIGKLKCEKVEKKLLSWILQCQHKRVALSGLAIQTKAQQLARVLNIPADKTPVFSEGWLWKFQKRHGLMSFNFSGESGSADLNAVRENLPQLRSIVEQFQPCDVFNMDETGLFFCMSPDRTIATRQLEGNKKSMIRMTIALTANADGSEKLEPLFIGKSLKPRAFKGKSPEQLGISYRANQKAWMTSLIFQEWLQNFDRKMRIAERKVLLLLDNAPSHVVVNLELKNITVQFLPPNTTSVIQPMDAGIIAAMKKRYRQFHINNALLQEAEGKLQDIYKVDILQAMRWCQEAWTMITPTTISNCWRHTGLTGQATLPSAREDAELESGLTKSLSELKLRNPLTLSEYLDPAHENEFVNEDIDVADIVMLDDACSEDSQEESEEEEVFNFELLTSSFRTVVRYLNQQQNVQFEIIRTLNKHLYEIVASQRQQRLETMKQSDIRSFFQ